MYVKTKLRVNKRFQKYSDEDKFSLLSNPRYTNINNIGNIRISHIIEGIISNNI